MKLKYMGKFSGAPEDIPLSEHSPENVEFLEPVTIRFSYIFWMLWIIVLLVVHFSLAFIWDKWAAASGETYYGWKGIFWMICAFLALFPHEIIHALFFKSEVRFYTSLRRGLIFVTGPEEMSRTRFILMCLAPNILFGLIPLIVFFIFPKLMFLGVFGSLSVLIGFEDYINAITAVFSKPKGEKIYIHTLSGYWYIQK